MRISHLVSGMIDVELLSDLHCIVQAIAPFYRTFKWLGRRYA